MRAIFLALLFVSCLELDSKKYNFDAGVPFVDSNCATRCQIPPSTCSDNKTLLVSKVSACDATNCQFVRVAVTCMKDCLNDRCVNEPCAGISCENAPSAFCKNENTLVRNATPGTCDPMGKCVFVSVEEKCASGCVNGSCADNPCVGKVCTVPPPVECSATGTALKSYYDGACVDGVCQFKTKETPCILACSNAACSAPPNARWILTSPQLSPSGRAGHAMVYDSARKKIVMFGGHTAQGFTNETWEFDGNTWAKISTDTSPSARDYHAMAYDAERKQAVLFGGSTPSYLSDTWVFDGTTWSLKVLNSSMVPSKRARHAMTYDSNRKRVVMFGGKDLNFANDIWEWNGVSWAAIGAANRPGVRTGMAMVFDSFRNSKVIFGGSSPPNYLNDTWIHGALGWTELTGTNAVPRRAFYSMAYDSARGRVVLFGGLSNGDPFDDTWELEGTTWTQSMVVPHPPGLEDAAMVFDSNRNKVVLFGGFGNGYHNETWEYSP
jgi:hypothetical protein